MMYKSKMEKMMFFISRKKKLFIGFFFREIEYQFFDQTTHTSKN